MKLGKAFSDNLIVEHRSQHRLNTSNMPSWWLGVGRPLLFASILIVALFILAIRLFHLTLIRGHEYRSLADTNRTRELIRHAPRGLLLDRTGKPLTTNIAQYRLIEPCKNNEERSCTKVLTQEEGNIVHQKGLPPGSYLEVDYRREYLYAEANAHVIGYTGELNPQELTQDYFILRNYHAGDRIGRTGAEAVFEDRLRGRDGRELVEIDASGKVLRRLGVDPEIPGQNITLSLDARLSEVARQAFPKDQKGAIIVTKPQTGEILTIFSSPSYNPNIFSSGLRQSQYDALMNNSDLPLFNRAIGGVYPPGSTFKIVTSIGGLEEKAITGDTTVEDTGVITIGTFTFPNWYFKQYGKTEGTVNLTKALARSNDIFFYKAGEWLGITKLASWARRVGIGKPLGIELGGEAGGLMPDPAWKNERFSSRSDRDARSNEWYLGDTYHVAIGQGYLLTTPLQVNAWTNVLANGGKLCKPSIEKNAAFKAQSPHCQDLGIHEETIDLITQGMEKACTEGGTGWPFFNFSIRKPDAPDASSAEASRTASLIKKKVPVACKTGTAEFGDSNNRTHAWFTAFAPIPEDDTTDHVIRGDPEISVTVLVEKGGEGSNVAAPIAKKIFEEWFSR